VIQGLETPQAQLPKAQLEQIQTDAVRLAGAMKQGPEAAKAVFNSLDPISQKVFAGVTNWQDVVQRGLTAEQTTTAAQAAAAAAETARHNRRVEELTSQGQTQTQANQIASNEGKLRDDFNQATKTYPAVREGYGRVQAARSGKSTGASDIALLYGFMKVMDPGSTVREGEFATAGNAGGVLENIRNMYNRAVSGERLTDKVRGEIGDQVEGLYSRATADYEKTRQQFVDIANRNKVDPRNVVIDYTSTATPGAAKPQKPPPTAAPAVGTIVPGKDGKKYTFLGGDPNDKNNYILWTPTTR
jgi:hypothetical protein